MMASEPRKTPKETVWSAMSWWTKFLVVLIGLVLWVLGLLFVGQKGYAGQYFWVSECAVAIGFAVAPFWRRRASIWYWPTVALLVIVNLTVIYAMRDYVAIGDLPSKGAVQGLLVLDCIASWLLMVGIAYLVDRKFPWSD